MLPTVPETMIAVEIAAPGGPEMLRAVSRPTPRPGAGELLVRVAAAGVNRADITQRLGKYPPPRGASDIPGLEIAGELVGLGSGTTGWRAGDRVCALVVAGGYAEYCVVPEPQCLPIPKGFDFVQGAALPEALFTVWDNLFDRGRLKAGETVLIHGGASGVGTIAIQTAAVAGATVFATAGSPDKCRLCEKLGATRAIDYRTEDFAAVIAELTEGRGVDVILDIVGGDYIARNLGALALEGRLVQIGFQEGANRKIDLRPIMTRRLTLTGSTLRPRSIADKAAIAAALRQQVWPNLETGRIKPVIAGTFPLADAYRAHGLLESGGHSGKIILVP
ncbi:MAG: NAD(P)H-quinone oxidoreductase [Pseudomonadota bacterium]